MSEVNKLNFNITAGKPNPQANKRVVHRTRTPFLEEVYAWIDSLNTDQNVKQELIKKVNNYPLEAMGRFRENIDFHIKSIRRKFSENDK